jgi:cytochrome c oxidase subunit II
MTRTSVATIIGLLAVLGMAGAWNRLASAEVPAGAEQVIHLTAKKFEFAPNEITLKKGVPVIVEITSLDRDHGFKVPELGVRADIKSGGTTRVRIVPDRVGRFEFRCDVFCGTGHEDMAGEFVIVD